MTVVLYDVLTASWHHNLVGPYGNIINVFTALHYQDAEELLLVSHMQDCKAF